MKLSATNLKFKRYLYDKINWETRLIGIKGARGVGKTTILLQRIKEYFPKKGEVLYVSLDNLWFKTHTLEELVAYEYAHGVTHLFLDEVHKYPDWSISIKNLYDTYNDLYIVYTGSSMLEIDYSKVDLSRRQTLYTLHGLSLREYMEFEGVMTTEPIALDDLLKRHIDIAFDLFQKTKVLKHFSNYLESGYYPFYKDAKKDYLLQLAEVANLVIDTDLPAVEEVTYSTVKKTKVLLMLIAQNLPLMPNINKLTVQLDTSRDLCLKMLYALDRAKLIQLLTENVKDYKHIITPKKIYLNNTNLMRALAIKSEIGTVRETFFANQTSAVATLTMPKKGDFLINSTSLFEVGGQGKKFDQIKDIPNSFLAVDDTEVGFGNRIPLWMFGFLY
jgi:predicted AAA+ superfamily ATPase